MEGNLPALPPTEVNLRDYLDVLRRRKAIMLQTFAVVLAVGILTTLLSRPVYEASAKLLVVASPPQVQMITQDNPLSQILNQTQPDSVATQIEVLQSAPFLERAHKLATRKNGGPHGGNQDESIRVAVVENTNVIRVTTQSRDPQYAADLANAILEEHSVETQQISGEQVTNAFDWVKNQTATAKAKLDKTEFDLGRFKRTHRTEDLQRQQDAKKQAYLDLQEKTREADYLLSAAKRRKTELELELNQTRPELTQTTYEINPEYIRLQGKIAAQEEKVDELSGQYADSSQTVVDAKAALRSLRNQLKHTDRRLEDTSPRPNPLADALQTKIAEASSEIRGIEAQKAHLDAELSTLRGPVELAGGWETELMALQRERDNAEKQWLSLEEKRRDLEIRAQAHPRMNRLVEGASRPIDPVRPKKAANIMLSIALATCLGLAMAFLQEYLDDRINSPEDADRTAHLPLLGHVPVIPASEPTVVTNLPARSHVAEAYRTLRSSIGFAAVDGELKTLMVTSPSKGEGKTVTSLNLAIAMALDGKKVILVDADLRRPSVHKQLKLPQGPGLTDVLVGQKQPEEVLNATEVLGLRVMTAGPIPPNPAELLNSQPMDRIIEQLRELADVVIFDTAPCIPVSDSIVLANKLDGVILVVHAGETKKAAVKHTREMLDRARARTLGLVFNRVPQRKGGYYYYYYYYYGGYYEDGPDAGRGRKKGRRRSTGDSAAIVRTDRSDEDET